MGSGELTRAQLRATAVALLALGSLVAAATAAGGEVRTAPTPVIEGAAVEGETLNVVEDANGLVPDVLRWQRCAPIGGECPNPASWEDISGAAGPGVTSYLLTAADVGAVVRVLGKYTSLGTQFWPSDPVGPVAPRPPDPPPEPPQEPAELPPPVVHETANLVPAGDGEVRVNLPGPGGWRPLAEAEQVPLRSLVDTRAGTVEVITAHSAEGDIQSAQFWAGIFRLDQAQGRRAVTEFVLAGAAPEVGSDRVARRGRGRRHLWGRGSCDCRTEGRHSSGTVRGTWWHTVDRPDGTLTRVKEGVVQVRDFAADRKVLVRAGERYLARADGS